jgi:ferredoxin
MTARPRGEAVEGPSLVVDPIRCDAHGLCAELLPELIQLDDWGYPIIRPGGIPLHLRDHVRRAVSACPTLALTVKMTDQAGTLRVRR